MKIAILGAGNGGCAVAADLSLKGHEVTLIKTSNSMHNENFKYLLENDGAISIWEKGETRYTHIAHVSTELSDMSEAELVVIYIQTGYHEELIKRMREHLRKDQIVLINPGYLSTAYFLKHCPVEELNLTIVECTSSFIDCRISEPGQIRAGFRNVRNPIGVYPHARTQEILGRLEPLGFHLHAWSTVEVALHNPNLIVHTVGAVMSIPRIEKTHGDYCMYHEVYSVDTPSMFKILNKLDAEKMDVLEKLGLPRMPYVEAAKFRNTLDDSMDALDSFLTYAAMPTRAKGPIIVNSRYITEDVPEGLVMLEALGQTLGVATPVCTALIEIANAALEREFRDVGRSVDRLGEENIKRLLKG